jgi:hypothetical protein
VLLLLLLLLYCLLLDGFCFFSDHLMLIGFWHYPSVNHM